jgi:hypothetical protein
MTLAHRPGTSGFSRRDVRVKACLVAKKKKTLVLVLLQREITEIIYHSFLGHQRCVSEKLAIELRRGIDVTVWQQSTFAATAMWQG